MPFQMKSFETGDSVSLQNIAGAYYRIHRVSQNVSLSFLANELHMNKGFLSELENGKRHFPAGVTRQLNEALDTRFCEDKNFYIQARKYLLEVFHNFFLERAHSIDEIYKTISENEEEIKDSYGFFVFLLIKLFYNLRIVRNDDNVLSIKEIINMNLRCLQKDEQAIYFCLLGIFYKRKTETNETALEYFLKSNSLCVPGSTINAMNTFQLISVYSELNQQIIAYRTCIECKPLLQMHNNYSRSIALDLFESATLTNLHLFKEAEDKLLRILSSTDNDILNFHTDRIYHSLAWNALLSENYDECIQYSKLARDNKDSSPDLCYFIPFALFKLGRYPEALKESEEAEKDCLDLYRPFLCSIEAKIKGEDDSFENSILIYYEQLLTNKVFEDILLIQKYMLDFYEETQNEKMLIKIYRDMDLFYRNQLTLYSSSLLDHSENIKNCRS